MKKTVNINLQGMIFNIDEDAYILLSTYLEKLSKHFGNNSEGDEIVKDIEARIAELFSEKLSEHRQVISIEDVKEIISILGDADDIIEGDINYESDNPQDKQEYSEKRKKLFRDSDKRIAGGVCAGLSAYTGINLFAMRGIFVILFFMSAGIIMLLYLLLWIIIPKARTRAEKLEMKGEKVNISNIEKNIREEYEEIKSNMQDIGKTGFGEGVERFGKSFASIINIIFTVFKKVFGVGIVILGLISLVSFVLGVFAFNSQTLVYDWAGITIIPISGILKLIAEPQTMYIFLIALALALCIPFFVMVYAGICILLDKTSNRILNLSLFISWLIGVLLCVGMGFIISTEFMSHRSVSKNYEIICETASCDTIYIYANDNKNNSEDVEGLVFESLRLYRKDGNINAEGRIEIELRQTSDSVFTIKEVKSSRGNNNSLASENAKQIKYDLIQENSKIFLNKYYKLPEDFMIRGQEVEIVIYIPTNKFIFIDESVKDLIDDTDNLNNIDETDMPGYLWKMTENGLMLPKH
jgi:phage shock protein PspC (stress-responsive transcriptional regulator)